MAGDSENTPLLAWSRPRYKRGGANSCIGGVLGHLAVPASNIITSVSGTRGPTREAEPNRVYPEELMPAQEGKYIRFG